MIDITNFKINNKNLKLCCDDLNTPSCIVKLNDDKILCTDTQYGIIEIDINNFNKKPYLEKNQYITGEKLCSFVIKNESTLLLANMAKGCIEIVSKNNPKKILFDNINGEPLGRVNFMCPDKHGGFYVTISSRKQDAAKSLNSKCQDGYLAHFDINNNIKIVAENLKFPNEARVDEKGEYLYVAETAGKCVSRFKILDNNNLGDKEIFGPENFGPGGYPDGICFDTQGNLWGTLVFGEILYFITKDQKLNIVLDLGNKDQIKKLDKEFNTNYISPDIGKSVANKIIPLPVSMTFAGKDNKTVFIGNNGKKLAYFRAPIAGL